MRIITLGFIGKTELRLAVPFMKPRTKDEVYNCLNGINVSDIIKYLKVEKKFTLEDVKKIYKILENTKND